MRVPPDLFAGFRETAALHRALPAIVVASGGVCFLKEDTVNENQNHPYSIKKRFYSDL